VKVKRPQRPVDRDDWREHLNRRLRTEFIAAGEARARHDIGRGLTEKELKRVLRNYSVDV
jgi:hypothetical protein